MCGIAGIVAPKGWSLDFGLGPTLGDAAGRMNTLQRHRGPDGSGVWAPADEKVALAHVRLSIIGLASGQQPMTLENRYAITFNGEIYNYLELRRQLGETSFRTTSDTEVLLRAYEEWGEDCLTKLRGMFSFAIWDRQSQELFFARDRFGIKPFYFVTERDVFAFASECKTLLPFLPTVAMAEDGLRDYVHFQLCFSGRTLFKGVRELPAAHSGKVRADGRLEIRRYWDVSYHPDAMLSEEECIEKLRATFFEAVDLHLRADVPVGAYLSGGVDSSLVTAVACERTNNDAPLAAFVGKFGAEKDFDESFYARAVAKERGLELFEQDITEADFVENIRRVAYHMDYPAAGPGAFPQYMVSRLVKQHRKVVLGGQGGDEIFGGYARYLVAYFEQCIRGAIEGTLDNEKFVVSYESIIPNLVSLSSYKPMIREFWSEGVFDEMDRRYFRLVNRANTLEGVVRPELLDRKTAYEAFRSVYFSNAVGHDSYFDGMTHFDLKTLLPGLLQVEDRMSMAHGVESRVPFLDHPLIELVATVPAMHKFKGGQLKRLLRKAFDRELPTAVKGRKDKMGFPVPLQRWLSRGGVLKTFLADTFSSQAARTRPWLAKPLDVDALVNQQGEFSRGIWGLLSLELWHSTFLNPPTGAGGANGR